MIQMQRHKKMLTHKQVLAEQLKDPNFRETWRESEPAYQLKRLRLIKNLSRKHSRPKRNGERR
jgi:hypothetical protein